MIFERIIHLIIRVSISKYIQYLTNAIINERNFNRFHFRPYFRRQSKLYTIEVYFLRHQTLIRYIDRAYSSKNTRKDNRKFNRKIFRPNYVLIERKKISNQYGCLFKHFFKTWVEFMFLQHLNLFFIRCILFNIRCF